MIFAAARAALSNVTEPQFRSALWKSVGLTVLALIGLWFAVTELFQWLILPWASAFLPDLPAWTDRVGLFAGVLAGIALALGLAFLIAPVTAIIAGLFLDDVAEMVEARDYPADPAGRAVPTGRAIVLSLKFFGVVMLGNLLALALLLVPGVNLIAFFAVNGYLLGREFFEFAAMRFRPEEEAKALRARHAGTVFSAGLVIAAMMAVPLVNLAAPLFAGAMMVHLHKRISRRESL